MSIDKLKERGWYLTEAGLKKLIEKPGAAAENKNNVLDEQAIIKLALDTDFRDIAGGALSTLLKQDALHGSAVLQLVKVRNCAAPKSNEDSKSASRLLKIQLTDGQTLCHAVEVENINALTFNLPPGTKILLKNGPIKYSHTMLQLKANNVEVLGGNVVALVEKWEINQSLAMYSKGNRPNLSSSGPPRWIPFGKPIPYSTKIDETFNSMAEAQTKIAAEENNSEFDSQRNDAISEAIKTENKKVFGGGTKQLQDANVQKVMEKGYTEEQAKTALRYSKNNVEQALNNLRKRDERNKGYSDMNNSKSLPSRKGGKMLNDKQEKLDVPSKPSTKISLFDFVEDKLPEDMIQTKSSSETSQNHGAPTKRSDQNHLAQGDNNNKNARAQNRFENNISTSFANRNQSGSHMPGQMGNHQQSASNNFYHSNRQDRNDNRDNRNTNQGYQGRRQTDYNNTNRGPSNYTGREKRFDQRDNYNSQQHHGPHNNRYQKDYNNQQSRHDFQSQPQSHQQPPQHQQKNDYKNDYRNEQKHEKSDDRHNQNYQSNNAQRGGSGYQRGGHAYNNQTRDSARNDKDRGNQQTGYYEYQSGAKPHHPSANSRPQNENYDKSRSGKPYHQSQYAKPENQQRRSPPYQSGNQQTPNVTAKSNVTKPPYNKPNTAGNPQQLNQIIDATANMKLNVSAVTSVPTPQPPNVSVANAPVPHHPAPPTPQQPQPQQQQQQQQPTTPQSAISKNFVPLPNGGYSPYQIMGFQNKATNEFAMNVLKTQQMPCTVPGHFTAVPSFVTGPPPVIPSTQPHNQFIPQGATAVFPMSAIPLMKWNAGDLCMAKYWEDGRFYPAEITAISENTNVVRFLDYNNFEEVMKHDCLPMNAGQPGFNAPQRSAPVAGGPTAVAVTHQPPAPPHPNTQGQVGNKPHREQRFYVPPPAQKRM